VFLYIFRFGDKSGKKVSAKTGWGKIAM